MVLELGEFVVVVERWGNLEYVSRGFDSRKSATVWYRQVMDMPRFESVDFKFSVRVVDVKLLKRLKELI